MSREDPQMKLRLPESLRDRIVEAAKANNRSMNAEIVARLDATFKAMGDLDAAAIPDRIVSIVRTTALGVMMDAWGAVDTVWKSGLYSEADKEFYDALYKKFGDLLDIKAAEIRDTAEYKKMSAPSLGDAIERSSGVQTDG